MAIRPSLGQVPGSDSATRFRQAGQFWALAAWIRAGVPVGRRVLVRSVSVVVDWLLAEELFQQEGPSVEFGAGARGQPLGEAEVVLARREQAAEEGPECWPWDCRAR